MSAAENAAAPIEFRTFGDEHVALMFDWLRRPHVAEWWGDPPTAEEIQDKYVRSPAVEAFIAYLGERPIGFIQSYVAMNSGDGWWPEERDPGVIGIDQFIGEPDLLGQGIGTAMVKSFVGRLLGRPEVTRIQTDPSPSNGRAIRCYEKVGFRAEGIVDTPDAPELYMTLDRGSYVP